MKIIDSSHCILSDLLRHSNNEIILRDVFEFEDRYDAFYFRLLEYSIDNQLKPEKTLLLRSLTRIPLKYLNANYSNLEYVRQFVTYNIFRQFKLIIDKKDSESFDMMLDNFSSSPRLTQSHNITDDVYVFLTPPYQKRISGESMIKLVEDLRSVLEYDFAKDYSLMADDHFLGKADSILASIEEKLAEQKIDNNYRVAKFKISLLHHYLSLLLGSVFFAVGSYLIYKGSDYASYLEKMLFLTDPKYSNTTYLNKLPSISDPLWQYCFCRYEGVGSELADQFKFANYAESKEYFWQYVALLMLKDNVFVEYPANFKPDGTNGYLMFWYEFFDLVKPEKFSTALARLDAKFLDILRIGDVENAKKSLEQKISELDERRQGLLDKVILLLPLSEGLINDEKNRIAGYYGKNSMLKDISNMKNTGNSDFNLKCVRSEERIPRYFFIEQKHIGIDLGSGENASELIDQEKRKVYDLICSKILPTTHQVNYEFLLNTIQEMKNRKLNPDVMFIPLDLLSQIQRERNHYDYQYLTIDNSRIKLIYSRKNWNFKNVVIYDSSYLHTFSNGLSVSVSDKDKLDVLFHLEVTMGMKIQSDDAFVNIHPTNTEN